CVRAGGRWGVGGRGCRYRRSTGTGSRSLRGRDGHVGQGASSHGLLGGMAYRHGGSRPPKAGGLLAPGGGGVFIGAAGGGAGGDQFLDGGHIQVTFQEVGEAVELSFPGGGEGN